MLSSFIGSLLAVVLVLDGKPTAEVVVPNPNRPVEMLAARELVAHVKMATGAELPIRFKATEGVTTIRLGRAAAGLDLSDLRVCESRIRIGETGVDIAGIDGDGPAMSIATPAGTLFGVYDFLEREVGVKWLWPGELGTVVPKTTTLDVPSAERRLSPLAFSVWRTRATPKQGWTKETNGRRFFADQELWLRRHRFSRCAGYDKGHAFTSYLKQYGETNPEYFNVLPDGSRKSDPFYFNSRPDLISMCVTEPGFIRRVVEVQQSHPSYDGILNANENDTAGKCCCPRCLAADGVGNDEMRLADARKRFAAKDRNWWKAFPNVSGRYCDFYNALLEEGSKKDPDCRVMGGIYANYSDPPPKGKMLSDRVILRFCPPIMYPWTPAKIAKFKNFWSGWSETGARLMLRPNFTLDGNGFPLLYYRPYAECFDFAYGHGLVAQDYDSLTGMFGANGLTFYVVAAKNGDPTKSLETIEDEYFSAFGKASEQIRAYMRHFEQASGSGGSAAGVSGEGAVGMEGGDWADFFTRAGRVFTPDVMREGFAILEKADAAEDDPIVRRRIDFLRIALKDACLVSKTQRGFERMKTSGVATDFSSPYRQLLDLRERHEGLGYANQSMLAHIEARIWPVYYGVLSRQARMIGPWRVRVGAAEGDDGWRDVQVTSHLRDEKGAFVNEVAWYRTSFEVNSDEAGRQAKLTFGALDGLPTVWLNDTCILTEHPVKTDDSWRKVFSVDVSGRIKAGENRLVVRVDKKLRGPRGIHRPVFLEVEKK